jgi:DNA repair protein RecO (recombination protein O)
VPTGELSTPAFVLHTRSYGESDRIVTLLTEHHGKLAGIAKGAKNSRRRFAGTLEPFVHIRAVFRQRPASDLVFLLRCELIEALRAFTRDLDRFAAGSYVLELTDRMVLGRESGGEVYRLVHEALALLADSPNGNAVLRSFELHLLAAAGYAPSWGHCRGCGTPVTGVAALYLAAERGGLVCRPCVRPNEPVRPVSREGAGTLAALADGSLADAAAIAGGRGLVEAARVADQLLRSVTNGPLRSRAFLARVDSLDTLR